MSHEPQFTQTCAALCGAQLGLVWGSAGTAIASPCPLVSQADEQTRACYEHTMAEWLGCEAIVRQREKESHAAALAKCSSGASLDSHIQRMMHRDSTISNEVRAWAVPTQSLCGVETQVLSSCAHLCALFLSVFYGSEMLITWCAPGGMEDALK